MASRKIGAKSRPFGIQLFGELGERVSSPQPFGPA